MIKAKMIPLNSALKDVYLLMRESDVNEDLIMEFAIRGMEHMVVYHTYEKAVCMLRVDNCQSPYPKGTYGIEAVLYKQELDPIDVELVTTATVNVEVDRRASILAFKEQHLGHDEASTVVVNICVKDHDTILEQAAVDVVAAFSA
jgi:hypothetical protein